jgi:hypothetical protein
MVGLPRESRISRAMTSTMAVMFRSQKSGVRSQKSGVRSQESEVTT